MWQTAPASGWSGWASSRSPPAEFQNHNGPSLAPSADGRLELFFVEGGILWHIWQTAPSNGWTNWVSHGSPAAAKVVGYPAQAPSADGRLELFTVGTDGALWHIWQTARSNGWSNWVSHGAPPGSGGLVLLPVIAPSADGRLELFVVGADGKLWHIWQTSPNNGWSNSTSHGTPSGVRLRSLQTPAIASSADGRLELFIVGSDGKLWHIWRPRPTTAGRIGHRTATHRKAAVPSQSV